MADRGDPTIVVLEADQPRRADANAVLLDVPHRVVMTLPGDAKLNVWTALA